MKKYLIPTLIAIIFLILGYLVGTKYPYYFGRKNILGSVKFRVTAITTENHPVENIEVIISKQPGPPDIGGEQHTNKEGIAIFTLKPGKYYLGVSTASIHSNLEYPYPPFQIVVQEGKENEQKLILRPK